MASDRIAVAGRREQLLTGAPQSAPLPADRRRLIVLAGPSGSGKSRVARLSDCPSVNLDDFYFDADHPDLPHTLGIINWDDPRTWDGSTAVAAVDQLLRTGAADVPRYDISRSARVGSHRIELGDARCFLAEGIFGIEMAEHCRAAGIACTALFLDRPRIVVMLLRFVRDVREHRKPLPILIRRGLALYRADAELKRRARAAGFRMVTLRRALSSCQTVDGL